jgi:ABC transport system ATP-binding/permease protein
MSSPALLSIRNGSFGYHHKPILENITLHLYPRDKICLIGRNGSGKSSLLKILSQTFTIDQGEFFQQPFLKTVMLSQKPTWHGEPTVEQFVLEPAKSYPDYQEKLRFQALALLQDLKVESTALMTQLSGGQQRRAVLVQTLIQPADIFLLDEPTNHLDILAIEWLENWIQNSQKLFLIVSHDRTFLKNVTNKTLWLENQKVFSCPYGFDKFEDWQESFLKDQEAQMAKMDQKLMQEMHWLHRGVTARRRRNQGRLKALHDLRKQRALFMQSHKKDDFKLEMGKGFSETKQLLYTEHLSFYRERPLFEDLSLRLLKGDRLGIIGPNGCGKSTLIKVLTGELQPTSGVIKHPKEFSFGIFQQYQPMEMENKTPWQFLCPDGGDTLMVQDRPRHVVAYLKEFLFQPAQAKLDISLLSGGEKNRLRLAKILSQKHPLLILDEPTNDLDIETLDFLQSTLMDYPGTLVIVSHDRDFLDQVVTSLIVFEEKGKVREYMGGFADYLKERGEKNLFFKKPAKSKGRKTSISTGAKTELNEGSESINLEKSTGRQNFRMSYHQKRLLTVLPEQIAEMEKEKQLLEEKISDYLQQGHHEHLAEWSVELEKLIIKIQNDEIHWLELLELSEKEDK